MQTLGGLQFCLSGLNQNFRGWGGGQEHPTPEVQRLKSAAFTLGKCPDSMRTPLTEPP